MDKPAWVIWILFGIASLIVKMVVEARQRSGAGLASRKRRAGARPKAPEKAHALPRAKRAVASGAARALDDGEAVRRKALARLAELQERAAQLNEVVRRERATRRFADTLTGFVPRELARARAAVATGKPVAHVAGAIELVLDEIEILAEQRRDPGLLPALGDADALADACYAPVIAFARAEGLRLTSGFPATQLTDVDLAVWTGFIPTSVAPIFLPADFFSSVTRWPAIAHEIGHDFLASVDYLEPALRRQLGVPDARTGARPLTLDADGIQASEIARVFGAWFEEIFCDVFGTLMCGPAYVTTMISVFAAKGNPHQVVAVARDRTGVVYDTHPPAHLRVLVGCMVLERGGFHADALELRERWAARHAGAPLDSLLFPVAGSWLALPLSRFMAIADGLVERLYMGPLDALSGFGLRDVSSVDYGPHEHQEAIRARDALLAGRVPTARDARAVIAGAVLAAQRQPEREAQILSRARAAIPAAGTSEQRPDAYTQGQGEGRGGARVGQVDRRAVMEALVLREILLPPRALRGRRRARL